MRTSGLGIGKLPFLPSPLVGEGGAKRRMRGWIRALAKSWTRGDNPSPGFAVAKPPSPTRGEGALPSWRNQRPNSLRLRQPVLPQIRIMRHAPVIHEPPWHRREHAAARIAIVGAHAGMSPDHGLMLGIDLADVVIEHVLTDVDRGDVVLDHVGETGGDVAALAFRLENHAAAVCRARVWSKHAEEVGEIRHGEAEERGRVVVAPGLAQILAAAAA